MKCFNIYVLLHSTLFLVLNYTFEADNDRRQMGLPSRVRFSQRYADQYSGSVTLPRQKSKECVTTSLVLQV